jgi:hypothetical protein
VTDVPIGSLLIATAEWRFVVTRAGGDLRGARTVTVDYGTMPSSTETKLTRR